MLKMKKNMLVVVMIMAMAMSTVLCGCGTPETAQANGAPVVTVSSAAISDEPVPAAAPDNGNDGSQGSTVDVRARMAANRGGNAGTGASAAAVETPSTDTGNGSTASAGNYDAAAISAIAGMKADVEGIENERNCTVFVDDGHNPYDVVWDYGRKYGAFVKAVDDAGMWDVLFDADFYTEHYPMLALQYHDDEALLLEHFQTVGIHEGRQGSDAFNVAAYMENCDAGLLSAFGEHYECYYFYWALNQGSEAKIDTRSNGHPIQMCVKLTGFQAYELKQVNKYRAEVGADPVTVHPELMAFAAYRAWCDYTGSYEAHEWFHEHLDVIDHILEIIGANTIAENTVYGNCEMSGPAIPTAAINYRYSKSHYEAMVGTAYHWFGCTNIYWGADGNTENSGRYCEYDVYVDRMDDYGIGM